MEAVKAKEVCPTTTQGLVKQGALLVDVREQNEVSQVAFDVPKILHIPLSELENRWQEIPREGDVVIVCGVGVRSLKATYYMMNRGYSNVMNMEHGMERWLKKGFPTKGELASISNTKAESGCCGSSETSKTSEETVASSCCGTNESSKDSACCDSSSSEASSSCCSSSSTSGGNSCC